MKTTLLLTAMLFLFSTRLAYAKNFDLVMGGFQSCRLKSKLEHSHFGKGGGPVISKTEAFVTKNSIYKSYLKYRTEENPFIMTCLTNTVKHDEKNPYDFKVKVLDSTKKDEFWMSFEDFIDYVDQRIYELKKKNKKLKVSVYGHSYGGWMSMQFIKEVNHHRIHKLITVDPISKPLCRVKNVIKTALNILPLVNFDLDKTKICNEFPRDISLNELDLIKDKTGTWYNFYQDKTKALHSSEAPIESIKNEKLDEGHVKIDNSETVWKKFFDLF